MGALAGLGVGAAAGGLIGALVGMGIPEYERYNDIEALPVDDDSVDVVISNCVLNLVPDKDRAFREIYRVLKPGRRLACRIWHGKPSHRLQVRKDMEALVGCIGGALVLDDYVGRLKRAGFARVDVEKHAEAARKMVEVSGTVPAGGHRASAEREPDSNQRRGAAVMKTMLFVCVHNAGRLASGRSISEQIRGRTSLSDSGGIGGYGSR